MPLSREDFVRANAGQPIAIPAGAFGPPQDRDETWPDYPELRLAVDWLKSFMAPGEWIARRDSAFIRLYGAALGVPASDGKGRFFDDTDSFGWYLFWLTRFLTIVGIMSPHSARVWCRCWRRSDALLSC
jgi:hypothetical protein